MISLNFVGDVSLFKEYERRNIDPLNEIWLPNSDYNIANFEFSIPNNRTKHFFDVSNEYAVSYNYFNKLKIARFNAYGLSNNHCLDYSIEGVSDVLEVFNLHSVASFGFGQKNFNTLKLDVKGISIGIISFVKNGRWNRNESQIEGPDSYNLNKIINEIKLIKKEKDHVIIFPHWGTELIDVPSLVDIDNARRFIDAGASAVIGHHPHIIQGIEKYNNGIIAYSLGSFVYIPEKEVGYRKSQGDSRNYSICLNLEFDKKQIKTITPHFYKYNPLKLIPEKIDDLKVRTYFEEINHRIGNTNYYNSQIKRQLIKREIFSFFQRLKKSPFKTVVHYFRYIKLEHIKKVFR